MNYLFTGLICLAVSIGFSQDENEPYSFYFNKDAGKDLKSVDQVDQRYFGNYTLVEREGNDMRVAAGDHLVIDETGIYIEKNRVHTISREEIRENSQYWITNGYLHGVIENDSLLVAPGDDDEYIFLMPVKAYLFEGGTGARMYRGMGQSDYLILSFEDNGYFSSLYMTISGGKIELKELDFDEDCSVTDINNQKEIQEEYPTFILSPTKTEWNSLFGCFKTYDSYTQ